MAVVRQSLKTKFNLFNYLLRNSDQRLEEVIFYSKPLKDLHTHISNYDNENLLLYNNRVCYLLPSISSTFYARVFHTKFWRQSQNVTRKKMLNEKRVQKMLVKSFLGINFINILRLAFTCAYPKRAKSTFKLSALFVLLRSVCEKAAHKMLAKLTLGQKGEREKSGHFSFTLFSLAHHCFLSSLPKIKYVLLCYISVFGSLYS